jgi:hypothetical protein
MGLYKQASEELIFKNATTSLFKGFAVPHIGDLFIFKPELA